MNIIQRRKDGTFERKNSLWTPETWNNGYIDNKSRFRVYRPDYPRAYSEGYALRAHVVYWLQTGTVHPEGTELHHKDGSRHNDVFENLIVLTKSDHRKEHQENFVLLICENCGDSFRVHVWRKTQREKEGNAIRFCSQKCFHEKRREKFKKNK